MCRKRLFSSAGISTGSPVLSPCLPSPPVLQDTGGLQCGRCADRRSRKQCHSLKRATRVSLGLGPAAAEAAGPWFEWTSLEALGLVVGRAEDGAGGVTCGSLVCRTVPSAIRENGFRAEPRRGSEQVRRALKHLENWKAAVRLPNCAVRHFPFSVRFSYKRAFFFFIICPNKLLKPNLWLSLTPKLTH